jgi:hypothetical protein
MCQRNWRESSRYNSMTLPIGLLFGLSVAYLAAQASRAMYFAPVVFLVLVRRLGDRLGAKAGG